MDCQFSYLRRRDSSVAMLRVKMSRRISQNQKENRGRAVDARRQLDNLTEQETNLDNSAVTNTPPMKDVTNVKEKSAKNKALEEKLKQLARWKERKALQKEKEKQERERKGVFKTGLYHPKDTVFSWPAVPAASKAKETKTNAAPSQISRVTRSMKQQQQQQLQKPLKTLRSNTAAKKDPPAPQTSTRAISVKAASGLDKKKKIEICAVGTVGRGHSTRSANRTVTAPPAVQNQTKDTLPDQRITRRRAIVSPSPRASASQRNCTADDNPAEHPLVTQDNPAPEEEFEKLKLTTRSEEETAAVDKGRVEPPSFAPEGFVFQAPAGLEAFSFVPLTPRSADRFLAPMSASPYLTRSQAKLERERQAAPRRSSPRRSPPPPPPLPLTAGSPMPSGPLHPKHDVPYFRSQLANESDRLTSLCDQWQTRGEDESIPEEMRGRVRTTVGQARLLMKERFNQFSGLVDDCELRRGAKLTTCSDLEGFWDMVYFQVEDVHRKFDALKEAEARNWLEEPKPPSPRQKKTVKKPAPAPAKPTGSNAGARSGLAAVKAAMRAQKKAAEAAKAAGDATDGEPRPSSRGAPRRSDVVVFDGGFFCVESPAKTPGGVRRSSRLGAAAPPYASPLTNHSTPRRASRRSLALGQTVRSPAQSKGTRTPLCRPGHRSSRCSPEPLPATSLPFQRENADAPAPFSLLVDAALGGGQLEAAARAQSEHLTLQEDVLLTVTKEPSPLTPQPPQAETAEASLFLFTPNPKDRIRQSVCPSDLMYFTPPL
ncbi:disks large-associated protein 5 isoform X2 [Hippocampus comes]|uniref:disks large-associated protein 5 isoform X2 n=1 Tax=Hippocampus comes TaxID=109280 RepID=UPI00094E65AD|nr:PREDICTED: disks large-associated protein 5 isoform X2 [Hippocampus comes]